MAQTTIRHGDIAWDIAKDDGTRTLMYESTNVVAFKEDAAGVEASVREFSIVELVRGPNGLVAKEQRSFMDPSPTALDSRGKTE
jgi:hypothetical protein